MLEWILVISQLVLGAAMIQLYRLRRRDASAEEEYRSIRFESDAGESIGASGQGLTPLGRENGATLESLAARLDQIIEHFDADLGEKGSAVRGLLADLETHAGRVGPNNQVAGPGTEASSPAEEVVKLQRSGLTVREIAQRTGRGQQEIELALGLQRPRKRSAS